VDVSELKTDMKWATEIIEPIPLRLFEMSSAMETQRMTTLYEVRVRVRVRVRFRVRFRVRVRVRVRRLRD